MTYLQSNPPWIIEYFKQIIETKSAEGYGGICRIIIISELSEIQCEKSLSSMWHVSTSILNVLIDSKRQGLVSI